MACSDAVAGADGVPELLNPKHSILKTLTVTHHRAGLAQPGKIMRGQRAAACRNHLHQLHVCLPAGRGRTRLLYRMSMDFLGWTRWLPGIQAFWAYIAQQVGGPSVPSSYI